MLSLAYVFREFLRSDFNLVAGELGDNRFIIAILEHWTAVMHGRASFRSPNFYWPQPGVLGYSESLFLYSLPYALVRASGADSYLAFELVLIFFKAVGFFSTLWLLRSFLRVSRTGAVIGATLFTISNIYCLGEAVGHAQLVAVTLLPLLTCFAWGASRAYEQNARVWAHAYSGSFGLLLALLLFTSFYIAWFGLFAGAVAALIGLFVITIRTRSFSPLLTWARFIASRRALLLTALLCFAVGIVPFLMTYIPTLHGTGGRTFPENMLYAYHPIDILDTGAKNWVWGSLLNKLMVKVSHRQMMPLETEVGWPPVTLALVLGATVWGLWPGAKQGSPASPRYKQRFLAGVLGLSFLLCWISAANFGRFSLWWLVFKLVPGGSAMRVPARIDFVLNVLAVLAISLLLNAFPLKNGARARWAFCAVAGLLLLEQINTEPNHLINRRAENALFAGVPRPPTSCASFFLLRPAAPDRFFVFNHIDAMLIAREYNLPTENGYSGWWPPDWTFLGFDQHYLQGIRHWVRERHVTGGLCGLDLRNDTWTSEDLTRADTLIGSEITFGPGGNARDYETEGWGGVEPGGTWELGDRSLLDLSLAARPTTDYQLSLNAHAFTAPQRPAFDVEVRVNGKALATWHIAASVGVHETAEIPLSLIRSGMLKIEFLDRDPRSPADVGFSTDARKLGLAFETLTLSPISKAR